MSLRKAIDKKRREISSDNLSMSIGEMLNLYKEKELDIHPEFQRVFRWGSEQKSRLIESLLLGIPLPPIYVAVNKGGVWEVIDGVQRLSTIFEFMGELAVPVNDDLGELEMRDGLELSATKHLPELDKVIYKTLDQTIKLEFKRTRLDVKVLSRNGEKSEAGKFDLFERLNTYGEPLSPQELRNCVLVSLNPVMFRWLRSLAENENFRNCTLLSDSQLLERYDMDLVLRFLALRSADMNQIGDIHDYLRERMEVMALDPGFDLAVEADRFNGVFDFLNEKLEGNAFRAISSKTSGFRGGFTLAGFEGVALTIGRYWDVIKLRKNEFDVNGFVGELWRQEEYTRSFSGLRARDRMMRVTPASERVIKDFLKFESLPQGRPARKRISKIK
jgi:hypothetical protein